MRLESTDILSLDSENLTITRGDRSGSKKIDPSFIKERLGFFESIVNKLYSLFSNNFWEKKDVTVGGHTETRYILSSKIEESILSQQSLKKSLSAISAANAATSKTPLLTSRPGTPVSDSSTSASSSRSTSPVPNSPYEKYVKAQKKMLEKTLTNYTTNIIQLQKAGSSIEKVDNHNLTIVFPGGSIHQLAGQLTTSNTYHHLLPTFELINTIVDQSTQNPDIKKQLLLKISVNNVNFTEYCTSCAHAIEYLLKQPESEEKTLALNVLRRSLFQAKRFEALSQELTIRKWESASDTRRFMPNLRTDGFK